MLCLWPLHERLRHVLCWSGTSFSTHTIVALWLHLAAHYLAACNISHVGIPIKHSPLQEIRTLSDSLGKESHEEKANAELLFGSHFGFEGKNGEITKLLDSELLSRGSSSVRTCA